MDILYITTEGFDTINANNHLNLSLIEDMLLTGYRVIMFQSRRTEFTVVPDRLQKYKDFSTIGVNRKNIPKKRMIARGVDEIRFFKNVLREIKISNITFDIIYYQSSGLSFYLLPKLKRISNKPIVMNIQDLFPNSVKSTGIKLLVPIIYLIDLLQKKTYKLVSKFVVISEDIFESLYRKGVPKNKIDVVYNWYDDEVIYPVKPSDNRFMKTYGLSEYRFVVQYAGNLGYVLDYDVFWKLSKRLADYKSIVIEIVGDGSNKDNLINICKSLNITNIEIYPIQPLDIVRDVYSYANICLIPLKKGVIFHSVPSKASVAMACSTPLLVACDQDSEFASNINSRKVGKSFSPDDVEGMAAYIIEQYSNKFLHLEYKKNALEYARTKLNRNVNTRKIINILKECRDHYMSGNDEKS